MNLQWALLTFDIAVPQNIASKDVEENRTKAIQITAQIKGSVDEERGTVMLRGHLFVDRRCHLERSSNS